MEAGTFLLLQVSSLYRWTHPQVHCCLPKTVRPNLEALALGIVELCTVLGMWVKTELEGPLEFIFYGPLLLVK